MTLNAFLSVVIFTGLALVSNLEAQTNDSPPQVEKDGKPKKEKGPFLSKFCPDLFKNDNPFDQSIDEFTKLCNLELEAKTKYMSSYRGYRPGVAIYGLIPNMMAAYGDPDHVSEISFLFANVGDDFGSGAGGLRVSTAPSGKEMSDFKKVFKDQETTLKTELEKLLGKSSSQQIGSGNNRESAQRWSAGENTVVMLAIKPQKFIIVRIWKKDLADRKGLLKPISDSDLRSLCASNVQKREKGDVVIGEIPMITQGNKGYCVPATYERVLRYLGMWGDMYTLAMNAQTQTGGGTTLRDINSAVGITLSQNGRRFQSVPQMNIPAIKKFISLGVPILWSCRIFESMELLTDQLTLQRVQMPGDEWKNILRQMHMPSTKGSMQGYHLRLVIGYNENTDEVCFSDSWSSRYAERWLPIKCARDITDNLEVIMW